MLLFWVEHISFIHWPATHSNQTGPKYRVWASFRSRDAGLHCSLVKLPLQLCSCLALIEASGFSASRRSPDRLTAAGCTRLRRCVHLHSTRYHPWCEWFLCSKPICSSGSPSISGFSRVIAITESEGSFVRANSRERIKHPGANLEGREYLEFQFGSAYNFTVLIIIDEAGPKLLICFQIRLLLFEHRSSPEYLCRLSPSSLRFHLLEPHACPHSLFDVIFT